MSSVCNNKKAHNNTRPTCSTTTYYLVICFYSTATTTSIDNGPDIYVSLGSKLVLTCRVFTAGLKLNYVIWRKGDKVGSTEASMSLYCTDHFCSDRALPWRGELRLAAAA